MGTNRCWAQVVKNVGVIAMLIGFALWGAILTSGSNVESLAFAKRSSRYQPIAATVSATP